MNEDGCLAVFLLAAIALLVLVMGAGIVGSLDDDDFKRACVDAGGYPVLSTDIGDLCVTETIEVEVPE